MSAEAAVCVCIWRGSTGSGEPRVLVGRRLPRLESDWAPRLGELRVLPGPEFEEGVRDGLTEAPWSVTSQSGGMGLVLAGRPLALAGAHDLLSAPVQDGTVQATAGGLIALLRERGTIGGYPRVATVIDCDVDRLAQIVPGNPIRFRFVSQDEARRRCEMQEALVEEHTFRTQI